MGNSTSLARKIEHAQFTEQGKYLKGVEFGKSPSLI